MPQFAMWRLSRFCPLLVLAAASLGAAGCGEPVGSVSGKVLYNGAAVKAGSVGFVDAQGKGYSSPIAEDGTYKIDKVPAGPVKVTVETSSILAAAKAPSYAPPADAKGSYTVPDAAKAKANYVKIPDKYEDAQKTDLTYTVTPGSQPHDIELK
jgi:hypothetical protein